MTVLSVEDFNKVYGAMTLVSSASTADIIDALGRHQIYVVGGEHPLDGAGLIAAERKRQITDEGYTAETDKKHPVRKFVQGAGAYLGLARWPWASAGFKYADGDGYYVKRNLVKAGALIAAAIDRMDMPEEV